MIALKWNRWATCPGALSSHPLALKSVKFCLFLCPTLPLELFQCAPHVTSFFHVVLFTVDLGCLSDKQLSVWVIIGMWELAATLCCYQYTLENICMPCLVVCKLWFPAHLRPLLLKAITRYFRNPSISLIFKWKKLLRFAFKWTYWMNRDNFQLMK